MQIKPAQLDGFLRKPTAKIVLVYGPDQGRVREISLHLLKAHEGNVVTLDGGDARDMIEAATARSLFGGEVAVRLREPGQKAVEALKAVLALSDSNPVVVEAGELATSSALRKLFESAGNAAAIACYAPEAAGLQALARTVLGRGGRKIDADALAWLGTALPPDTMAARSELEKLDLYLGEAPVCRLEDARAALRDDAEFALDDAAMSAADGDFQGLARALRRLSDDGESAIGILRLAQRHMHRLRDIRMKVDAGAALDTVVDGLRPPVFFKAKPRLKAQAGRWRLNRIEQALGRLIEAEAQCKQTGYPDEAVAAHALLTIAAMTKEEARK